MTIDELRQRFWWLGPGTRNEPSYIVALEGDAVTIKVIQTTWNRRTQRYEEAVARDFASLGLTVRWQPFWSESLNAQIKKAREDAEAKAVAFDESEFIERQRREERSREAGNR